MRDRKPLLRIPERNWTKISQQRFAGILWATDDMVHKHRIFLHLQCQQCNHRGLSKSGEKKVNSNQDDWKNNLFIEFEWKII